MCCVSVGSQKLQERWQAEQTKRQRLLASGNKLGFGLWGVKKTWIGSV